MQLEIALCEIKSSCESYPGKWIICDFSAKKGDSGKQRNVHIKGYTSLLAFPYYFEA